MNTHFNLTTWFSVSLIMIALPLFWSCGSESVQPIASTEPFTLDAVAKSTYEKTTWNDPGDIYGNTWEVDYFIPRSPGNDHIRGTVNGKYFDGWVATTKEIDPAEQCGGGKAIVTTALSFGVFCTVTNCPDNPSKDRVKCISMGYTLLDSPLDPKMAGQHMAESEPAIDGVEVLLDSPLMGKSVEIVEY